MPATPSSSAPKPRTTAQAEASRANGARSRGPATPEGRVRSARNALRHGLRAQKVVLLPEEDEAAFHDLCRRMEAEHAPRDSVERALVGQLALVFWRMMRVEALEVEVLSTREPRLSPNHTGGYLTNSPLMWDAARLNTVLRYRAQLERGLQRLLACLDERRAARAHDVSPTRALGPVLPNEPGPDREQTGGCRALVADEAAKRLDGASTASYRGR